MPLNKPVLPVLRDKATAIFETGDNSQVIAKYLDSRLDLDLFPRQWEGIQELIWPYIENDLEGIGFKLNDIYWREFVELSDQLRFLRHKERKFGRGCIDQWKRNQKELLKEFGDKLLPFEKMLSSRPFLLDQHPRFVDFNLYGIIANVLFTRHYRLPARHKRLTEWYGRIKLVRH